MDVCENLCRSTVFHQRLIQCDSFWRFGKIAQQKACVGQRPKWSLAACVLRGCDRTFNDDFKFQLADQNAVARLQDRLALNPLAIDEGAIRAAQVAEADAEIIQREDAMMSAHRFTGGT